jgi:hypothetical protein
LPETPALVTEFGSPRWRDYYRQRAQATAEPQQVVRSLTETFFQWQKDLVAYETARAKLAAMIVAAAEAPPAGNVRAEAAGGRSAWFPFVPVKDDCS